MRHRTSARHVDTMRAQKNPPMPALTTASMTPVHPPRRARSGALRNRAAAHSRACAARTRYAVVHIRRRGGVAPREVPNGQDDVQEREERNGAHNLRRHDPQRSAHKPRARAGTPRTTRFSVSSVDEIVHPCEPGVRGRGDTRDDTHKYKYKCKHAFENASVFLNTNTPARAFAMSSKIDANTTRAAASQHRPSPSMNGEPTPLFPNAAQCTIWTARQCVARCEAPPGEGGGRRRT